MKVSSGNNHGPVTVYGQHQLAYADSTPQYSLGTTCYTFGLQKESIIEETFSELEKGYFNKLRFCTMPKHYDFCLHDPTAFPYEGEYYFFYFSIWRPPFRQIYIDDDTWYDAEIIDTWDMTVMPAGRHRVRYELKLPGTQYIDIRLKKYSC